MAPSNVTQDLLQSILPHVAFDGWCEVSFRAAINDLEIEPTVARAACPRGAVDLAVAFHKSGDAQMTAQAAHQPMSNLRYAERVAALIRMRIEAIGDKEAARRSHILFVMPQHALEGAGLIWATADSIWVALADTSEDLNWYTKRATLSTVYAATVLYWLGDNSKDHVDTWAFLARRIENVMQVEKTKAALRENQLTRPLMQAHEWFGQQIKRPISMPRMDFPGTFHSQPPAGRN